MLSLVKISCMHLYVLDQLTPNTLKGSVSDCRSLCPQAVEPDVHRWSGHPLPARVEGPLGHAAHDFGEVGCFLSHYSIWQQVRRIGLSCEAWLVLVHGNRYRGHGGSALMGGVVSPRGRCGQPSWQQVQRSRRVSPHGRCGQPSWEVWSALVATGTEVTEGRPSWEVWSAHEA